MKSITKDAKELLKRRNLLRSSLFSNTSNENELKKTFKEKLEKYREVKII